MKKEICEICGLEQDEIALGDHSCIEILKSRLDYILDCCLGDTDQTQDEFNALLSEIYSYADYKRKG